MNFFKKWLLLIRNCSFDNTYETAWAKALTEIAAEQEELFQTEEVILVEIRLRDIAEKYFAIILSKPFSLLSSKVQIP